MRKFKDYCYKRKSEASFLGIIHREARSQFEMPRDGEQDSQRKSEGDWKTWDEQHKGQTKRTNSILKLEGES